LYSTYTGFTQNNEINIKTLSSKELYAAITARVPNTDYSTLIYIISYLASFDNNNFKANHYNFGNVWLTYNRGTITNYNQNIEQFFCSKNLITLSEQPYAMFPSLDSYIDYMARVIDRVYGKLGYYKLQNKFDPTRAPIVDAYIISWLYGEDSIGEVNASNTYDKLNASGYYDKLKLKTKAAGDSLKAINPKAFEKEVENYVEVENSLNKEKKITTVEEGCIFSYKAPNVVTNMSIGVIEVPYNITIKYSAKKIEELFYTENVVKEIEVKKCYVYITMRNSFSFCQRF
jgi:hypothetical protein